MLRPFIYLILLPLCLHTYAGEAQEGVGQVVTVEPELDLKPAITSPASIQVQFGESFEYVIEAVNDAIGYSVKKMPFWMEREKNILRGKAIKPGTFKLTLYALNRHGVSEPFKLKIDVISGSKQQK